MVGRLARCRILSCLLVLSLVETAHAQRVDMPQNYGAAAVSPTPNWGAPPISPTPNWGAPVAAQPGAPPGVSLAPGIQAFDPYTLPSGAPTMPAPLGSPPQSGVPQVFPQAPAYPYATPPVAPPTTPYGALPPTPLMQKEMFTSGLPPYQRLFQDTGFRYTWLYGDKGDELQINEVDASTSAYFPNFLGARGPLKVTPGFTLTLLDGPSPPVTEDLPARVYAAYLDFGWTPQFTPEVGGSINFRPGVYSDYSTVTNDSVRFTGTGIGIIRMTPATSLKLGVSYFDRADIKLLPAFGVLWQPNPQTQWDIFFPQPKLAKYWTSVSNKEVWWYLGAEYGGGSWSAENLNGNLGSTRFDINDIRVYFGIDWRSLNRWSSFLEVGYVFERKIYYVVEAIELRLNDTVMLRGGIAF